MSKGGDADPVLRARAWGRIAIDRSGDSERAAEPQRRVVEELIASVGEEDPRTAGAINNLGSFLENTGDLEEAPRRLGEAHLTVARALVGRAELHAPSEPADAARSDVGRALELVGDRDRGLRARALVAAARAHLAVGRRPLAIERAREAIAALDRGDARDRRLAGPRLRAILADLDLDAPGRLR